MEPYYNSSYGLGLQGVVNYTNTIVSGWLVNLFLITTFIVVMFVGSKSEWKMTTVLSSCFFITFVEGMLFSVITTVHPWVMYICGIGLAFSIAMMLIQSRMK